MSAKPRAAYALWDTFNGRVLSRHRTIEAAARADLAYARAVTRANGSGSYIPTQCRTRDGVDVDPDEWAAAIERAH